MTSKINKTMDQHIISKLKEELKDVQQLFREFTEGNSETYDMRHTHMLKAQIVQLERQCMLLSQALSSKASIMIETENAIIGLMKDFQEYLALGTAGPHVWISRKNIVRHLELLHKLNAGFHKCSLSSRVEHLHVPQISGLKFSTTDTLSCLDICTGSHDHVNLQQVAKLEENLAKLFKKLISLQELLKTCSVRDDEKYNEFLYMPEKYLCSSYFKTIQSKANDCIHNLEECCEDLFFVSLLHPSAPWPAIEKSTKFHMFDTKTIMPMLQSGHKRKMETKQLINSMCKAHNYLMHLNSLQLKSVKEELQFCTLANRVQVHHINLLLQGVTNAYKDCEFDLKQCISQPIANILCAWKKMKQSHSQVTLRQFLNVMRENESILQVVADKSLMSPYGFEQCSHKATKGSDIKSLEDIGVNLHKSIAAIQVQCVKECEKLAHQIKQYEVENEGQMSDFLKTLSVD